MPDTLSAIFAALDITATRRTVLEARGTWALAYPAADRLKFVAVVRGQCWLTASHAPPRQLSMGDIALIGRAGYVVADDPGTAPVDGSPFYADRQDHLRLGGDDTILLGGGVTLAAGMAEFLLEMLPPMLVIERASTTAGAVSAILHLLDQEARDPQPGGEAATARLAELLVIEAIRSQLHQPAEGRTGWLAALADPRLSRALRAFHGNVGQPWTVAQLARIAGMSRAAFAAAFLHTVGRTPNAYLRAWRLTLASIHLRAGVPIAQAAAEVGYTSQSAFGHAYRRAFGVSPGAARLPRPQGAARVRAA